MDALVPLTGTSRLIPEALMDRQSLALAKEVRAILSAGSLPSNLTNAVQLAFLNRPLLGKIPEIASREPDVTGVTPEMLGRALVRCLGRLSHSRTAVIKECRERVLEMLREKAG